LIPERCYCDELPILALKNRFSFLVHYKETFRPSNTSLPAHRCLSNSDLILRGLGLEDNRELTIQNGYIPLYLFPEEGAIPVHEIEPGAGPYQIVVPDGNWRQARRARKRIWGVKEIPAISLGPKKNLIYTLRKSTIIEGMCTLEAVAKVVEHLEGVEAGNVLESLLRMIVNRVEMSRGVRKNT
jgi:DTW domain-containing protein YfiP